MLILLNRESMTIRGRVAHRASLPHAICSLLSGIGDFRRKKHENLCTSHSQNHSPRQDQSGSVGQSRGKRLDAAAIKISVGFYKNCAAIFYTYKNNIIT